MNVGERDHGKITDEVCVVRERFWGGKTVEMMHNQPHSFSGDLRGASERAEQGSAADVTEGDKRHVDLWPQLSRILGDLKSG